MIRNGGQSGRRCRRRCRGRGPGRDTYADESLAPATEDARLDSRESSLLALVGTVAAGALLTGVQRLIEHRSRKQLSSASRINELNYDKPKELP